MLNNKRLLIKNSEPIWLSDSKFKIQYQEYLSNNNDRDIIKD